MFAAAASFSGIVHTRLSADESRAYLGLLESEGEHPYGLWGSPTVDEGIWAAHNPYDLAAALRTTPIFVSVGNGRPGPLNPDGSADDLEEALHGENAAFRDRLVELGVPATIDFYGPGAHDWPSGNARCTAPGRCLPSHCDEDGSAVARSGVSRWS